MFHVKKMVKIVFLFVSFSGFLFACQSAEALPFDQVCDLANDGATVSTHGFFSVGASVYCSDVSGKYRCGLNFNAYPDGDLTFSADVVEGKRKNQMLPLERNFTDESVRITTASGEVIGINDPVIVTGKMLVAENVCVMYVNKIEINQ
jgi:hypothetical protein